MTLHAVRDAVRLWVLGLTCATVGWAAQAGDQPHWGDRFSRNMVSSETGLPTVMDPQTGQNIKWSAVLGTESYATPVVAGGRVYIGTNNEVPREPRLQGDCGVLLCLAERDGALLWQLVVPKREEDPFHDWPKSGLSSPPTVEGDRVYVVSNRGEVLCLDALGMANGNDGPFQDEGRHMTPRDQAALEAGPLDADILWLFDLTEGAGIWSHDAAHSSILIDGDHLYLNTGSGVDNTHKVIRRPDAPGLIVLDKRTGRYLARDREGMGTNTFHCTWSSPSMGTVEGRRLVVFAGGDGVLYGFQPLADASLTSEVQTLRRLWRFDCDPTAPKEEIHRYHLNRREGPSNIYGMPVLAGHRVYVAGGGDLFWGKVQAWLQCVDIRGEGDLTPRGPAWSYPLVRHTISTPAVAGGLVFIADVGRTVHCLDAATGRPHWTQETEGDIWASPLVADGKVYIGTRRGDFWVFAADAEKRVLHKVNLGGPISGTVTAANGALYVATMTRLFAMAQGAK